MIAYVSCVADHEKFAQICRPGLDNVLSEGDLVIETSHSTSIFTAYNEVLVELSTYDDLEAAVFLHEDLRIDSPLFVDRILEHLSEDVAIVGAVGAVWPWCLAWWRGDAKGRVRETRGLVNFSGGTHDVHSVDGMLMAFSPWAVRNLRFDETTYSGFDGYDLDICAEALRAGKRVVCTDLPIFHDTGREQASPGSTEREGEVGNPFQRADALFRTKWPERRARAVAAQRNDGEIARGEWSHLLTDLVPPSARRILEVDGPPVQTRALRARPDVTLYSLTNSIGVHGLDDGAMADVEHGTLDAIILDDAIERVVDPDKLLTDFSPFLSANGMIVMSAQNASHWATICNSTLYDVLAEDLMPDDRVTRVHAFTLPDLLELLDRVGLTAAEITGVAGGEMPPHAAHLVDAVTSISGGESDVMTRVVAGRFFVAARRSGNKPAHAARTPDRGSMECPSAEVFIPVDAANVVRLDRALGNGGSPAADDDAMRALEGYAEASADVIVIGRLMEHVVDTGPVLSRCRDIVRPGGRIVGSVANVSGTALAGELLETGRWTYGKGALAGYPVRMMTLQGLIDRGANAGLYVGERVAEQGPAPDAALAEHLAAMGVDVLGEGDIVRQRLGIARWAFTYCRA